MNGEKPLAVVDLFCGCGGLSLGVWEAARIAGRRFSVKLALDLRKEPLSVFGANLDRFSKHIVQTDIREMFDGKLGSPPTPNERAWKKKVGKVDFLLAGPPCQGHSDLNNHSRRDDKRNGLYLKTIRGIEILAPQAILIENVPTVVHDRNHVVEKSCSRLEKLGYAIFTEILDLSSFAVPQRRRRHVLIATRKEFDVEGAIQRATREPYAASAFLSGLEEEPETLEGPFYRPSQMSEENIERARFLFKKDIYELPDELRPPCHRMKTHSYVSMYGRMRWDQPCQTITGGFGSMGQGRHLHPTRPRTLTPHEAARLQGFPDFFDFSSIPQLTALRKMIANAVPPQLSAVIADALLSAKQI